MIEPVDVVADDRLVAVADRMPLPIGLELSWSGPRRREWELRQPVRTQSTGLRYELDSFVEVLVQLIRDNGSPFRGSRTEAARMIPVMMGVNDIPNRFARNEPFGFGDHRVGARIVQRSFDDGREVLELDRNAVMRAAGDEPYAFGELRGLNIDPWRCRVPHCVGHR